MKVFCRYVLFFLSLYLCLHAKIKNQIKRENRPRLFLIFGRGTNLVLFKKLVLIKKTKLGGHNYDKEKF